jgi:hypothetical protein
VRREVYAAMQERLDLPACNHRFGKPIVPYFQPMVVAEHDVDQPPGASPRFERARGTVPYCSADFAKLGRSPSSWYLPEDYAFCERARRCGFQIMADTTIRLWHQGSYGFTWKTPARTKNAMRRSTSTSPKWKRGAR